MAKNYRSVYSKLAGENLGSIGGFVCVAAITPIDSQQSMGAFLANVKVSAHLDNMEAGPGAAAFHVVAATDDTALGDTEVITSFATAAGGGSGNLSVKRRIRDSATDESRSDGPVYIWIRATRNMVSTGEDTYVNFVCEAWGRFLDISAP